MKHELNITIGKDPSKPPILRMKTISVREKILRRLFGPEQRLTVLIPGRSIETVDIKEIEGDEKDDKDKTTDPCV